MSREFVQASAAQLKELCERKFGELDLVALLIDGIEIGKQVLVVALGIATSGEKHVLGLWQGATENTTVVKSLLEDLVARGLKQDRQYLFVIDGAKALRAAIEKVFGGRAEVQRCQIHIAGRDPRLPEGWNVPSRASPYEPGSLGSGMAR